MTDDGSAPPVRLSPRPARLVVGLVDATPLGVAVAAALDATGHRVLLAAAEPDQLERLTAAIPSVIVRPTEAVVTGSDLVVLGSQPSTLGEQVARIAASGTVKPGHIYIHLVAEYGTAVLQPLADLGALTLAIHPAMIATDTSLDVSRLAASYCAISAPHALLPIAQGLVVEMGAEPVVIAEHHRPAYAQAVKACTVELPELVTRIATQVQGALIEAWGCAGDQVAARQLITPLIMGAIEAALENAHVLDQGKNAC